MALNWRMGFANLGSGLAALQAQQEASKLKNAQIANYEADNARLQAQTDEANALKEEQRQKAARENAMMEEEGVKITPEIAAFVSQMRAQPNIAATNQATSAAMAAPKGSDIGTGSMTTTPELQASAQQPGFGDLLASQQSKIGVAPIMPKADMGGNPAQMSPVNKMSFDPEVAKAITSLSNRQTTSFDKINPNDINPLMANNQFRRAILQTPIAASPDPRAINLTKQVNGLQDEIDKEKAAEENRRFQAEQNALRLAEIRAGKEKAQDLKLDDSERKLYGQMARDLSTKMNTSRGQLGALVGIANRANRELKTIDAAISGDIKSTKQLWRELNTGFASILGSSNAVSQIDELTATSAASDLKNRMQYLKDAPENSISPEWLKALRHSIERVSSVSNETLDRMADAEVELRGEYLSDKGKEALTKYARNYVRGIEYSPTEKNSTAQTDIDASLDKYFGPSK